MKVPLSYQISEFDCGKTSLENAFRFLFEREEIPAEILNLISDYTMDYYNENGDAGGGGTSIEAIKLFSKRLNQYAEVKNFPIFSLHFTEDKVTLEKILVALKYGGCILLRTNFGEEHYILITKADREYIYFWDPYYLDNLSLIEEYPFTYNRKIEIDNFKKCDNTFFTLGIESRRECLILYRK